jgi:hypothetical protein
MNYSILNNYTYESKSFFQSGIDLLSTPLRRTLGGRKINLLTGEEDKVLSTKDKIATVVSSLILFPVAVISGISLGIKLISSSLQGERKKVQEAWDKMNQVKGEFDRAYQQNQYASALQKLETLPGIKTVKQDELYQIWLNYVNIYPLKAMYDLPKKYLNESNTLKLIKEIIKHHLENSPKQFTVEDFGELILSAPLSRSQKIPFINELIKEFEPKEGDERVTKLIKLKLGLILFELLRMQELIEASSEKESSLNNLKKMTIKIRNKNRVFDLIRKVDPEIVYFIFLQMDFKQRIRYIDNKIENT